jgi:predicted transcriptional regulator
MIAKGVSLAEVVIREELWKKLVALARRRRQKAESLAEQALRDYVRRAADEELLERSERAAHRTKFRISETEEIVRKLRRSRKRT